MPRITINTHPLVGKYVCKNDLLKGWGYRPSGLTAKNSGRPYILFEDAFVRSLKPGYDGAVYGITVDRSGAIFDAEHGCDLISLIANKNTIDPQTRSLLAEFRKNGISKYNWFSDVDISKYSPGVLLIDQSRGDASLQYGGMTPEDFTRMFKDALLEHPEAIIYIRTHPDKHFRGKKSCFSNDILNHARVHLIHSSIPPKQCFEFCHTIYTGTSLIGMEALLHGKKVISYGWSFYAGWGLTDDRCHFKRRLLRPKTVTLEQLFEAAYVDYCLYYDPNTGEPCTLTEIIMHIVLQKKTWKLFAGHNDIVVSNRWKKHLYELYISGANCKMTFYKDVKSLPEDTDRRMVWGIKDQGKGLTRTEDGFLRSKGLGAEFNLPLSLVFDQVGIYFDASSPSRLEQILEKSALSPEQQNQTQKLVSIIVRNNLTKYNFPRIDALLPPEANGKRIILVPGQVEDDASIQLGSPIVKTNAHLLKLVRKANPHAYICFKPHPDLSAKLRKGKPLTQEMTKSFDHLILEGDVISWVKLADEIHTMTSTVGFEALLHKKHVTTYGMPFYAGWGLTNDHLVCKRRTKTLSIESLVHGVLIEYPTYLNPQTGEYITAMTAAQILSCPDYLNQKPKWSWRFLLWVKKFKNIAHGVHLK